MSDSPRIALIGMDGVGRASNLLIAEIAALKLISSDPQVRLAVRDQEKYFDLNKVEEAVKGDVVSFIMENFDIPKHKTFKFGGNSEPIMIDNPDAFDENGFKKKVNARLRHGSNFTPKKKKRKKK